MTNGYVPTLLEYAKVIDFLWCERHDIHQKHPAGVHMSDFPDGLAKPFEDALRRVSLSRVADAMVERLDVDEENEHTEAYQWCDYCQEDVGRTSHYHCAKCGEQSSMYGHFVGPDKPFSCEVGRHV